MPGPYYVDSNAVGGGTGADWANAYTTFAAGVSAATADGDFIYVAHNHSESLAADAIYTFTNNVRVICRNSGTDALATGGLIGAQATNYSISIAGAYRLYFYGITLQTGTNGSLSKLINIDNTDGQHTEYESCNFNLNASAGGRLNVGQSGTSQNRFLKFTNCVFKFSQTSAQCLVSSGGRVEMYGCSISAAGSVPVYFFNPSGAGLVLYAEGCDFSKMGASNYLIADASVAGTAQITLVNCKLGSANILTSQTGILNRGGTTVLALNCSSADTHYAMYHADPFGSTIVDATIYANDGASYDGTNRCSWKIVTTANCSFYAPYVSPWIDRYNSTTSAVTLSLEGLRDGSATVIQDDEVWGEFSYQGTSGVPLATLVRDRMAVLGSAADQTSTLGTGDWAGESGTASTFKLESASVTPAEIGHLRARVCVGEPSLTVYVDPRVRVA